MSSARGRLRPHVLSAFLCLLPEPHTTVDWYRRCAETGPEAETPASLTDAITLGCVRVEFRALLVEFPSGNCWAFVSSPVRHCIG